MDICLGRGGIKSIIHLKCCTTKKWKMILKFDLFWGPLYQPQKGQWASRLLGQCLDVLHHPQSPRLFHLIKRRLKPTGWLLPPDSAFTSNSMCVYECSCPPDGDSPRCPSQGVNFGGSHSPRCEPTPSIPITIPCVSPKALMGKKKRQ